MLKGNYHEISLQIRCYYLEIFVHIAAATTESTTTTERTTTTEKTTSKCFSIQKLPCLRSFQLEFNRKILQLCNGHSKCFMHVKAQK